MALKYSCPAKENGIPSRRIFRMAQPARGSVNERLVGLASSFFLFSR
jgi:hypothetical protein